MREAVKRWPMVLSHSLVLAIGLLFSQTPAPVHQETRYKSSYKRGMSYIAIDPSKLEKEGQLSKKPVLAIVRNEKKKENNKCLMTNQMVKLVQREPFPVVELKNSIVPDLLSCLLTKNFNCKIANMSSANHLPLCKKKGRIRYGWMP